MTWTRKSVLALVAAGLIAAAAAAPADAQRGRGNGGNHNNNSGHNNNWNGNRGHNNDHRDWNNNRNYDRHDNDWRFSFNFGVPYRSYDYYRPYYRYSPGITVYSAPAYYNAWGLRPYGCRVDYEFDYWYGRPADVEVRRCADAYGNVYIVDGSRRLWRYR